QDNFVLIPISTFFKDFGSRRSVTIHVKTSNSSKLETAQAQGRTILRSRRHIAYNNPDSFYVATAETFLSVSSSISYGFFLVFLMISSIASIVGGIVIMNIMLVSVTERIK